MTLTTEDYKSNRTHIQTQSLQSAHLDNASTTRIQENPTKLLEPKMMSWEQAEDIDNMIVVGYLFVYDSEWQDVPHHLQKNLLKIFADTEDFTMDEFEPEKIQNRWTYVKDMKLPIYKYWIEKSKEDKEIRDYCYRWGMWV